MILKPLAAALVVLLATATHAFAWGYEGHRIIADIAEQYLEPATARQVRALLALENETTLADIANWADQIRRQRPETAPWHFVDIPIRPDPGTPATYDPARDCPGGNCVVAKISQFAAELRGDRLPPRQRLEALKFVVHFIGDLHQPLHASDNDDRGGNKIHVWFNGSDTNLHRVWDSGIIDAATGGDERGYALRLARSVTPSQLKRWRRGSAVTWTNESHAIAVRLIYGRLPHAGELLGGYEQAALPIVNRQLERAGARLAMVLNSAFSQEGTMNRMGVATASAVMLHAVAANAAQFTAEQAAQHAGQKATVCDVVASAHYAPRSRSQPTFLDLGQPYPNSPFTAVIFGRDRSKFGTPEVTLDGKKVCITGAIQMYRGKPEIILHETDQLAAP